MKTGDLYPSRYLKASDVEDGDVVMTIADIRSERIGQGRDAEDKWVVFFQEEERGMVLNKTNVGLITRLYGDETDEWIGKQVTLYSCDVQFQGDMVAAIRIRNKPPRPAKVAPAPAPVAAARPAKGKPSRHVNEDAEDAGDEGEAPF